MIINTNYLNHLRKKCVLVDGCFDPLHNGHIVYFKYAISFRFPVLCNLETDLYIRKVKRRPPFLPEIQRIQLIDSIKYISYIYLQQTTTSDVLKKVQPVRYIKGYDWKKGGLPHDELEVCRKFGIEVTFMEKNLESSTDLLNKYVQNLKLFSK